LQPDLESAADRQKLSNPVLYLQNHQDKLIILDEIQQMPQLMECIKKCVAILTKFFI